MENPLKNVPKPVLIAGGGAVIGLGYMALRSRGENAEGEPVPAEDPLLYPATPVADAYTGVSYESQVPSGIAYVNGSASGEDAASTVGAVGQTALDSVLGLATAAVDALGRQANVATEQQNATAQTSIGASAGQAGTATQAQAETAQAVIAQPATQELTPELIAALRAPAPAPVITMPSPQPPPPARPAAPPAATKTAALPAGYSRFPMPVKHRKTFPGAVGWARIASGGTGAKHWIDYHIRFATGKIQRWRYLPNVSGGRWTKIWGN